VIVLEILHGTASQRAFRLFASGAAEGTVTIGRSPASTVVVTDFHLSGDHAQISQIGDHFVFRDLRSTNGSASSRTYDLCQNASHHARCSVMSLSASTVLTAAIAVGNGSAGVGVIGMPVLWTLVMTRAA